MDIKYILILVYVCDLAIGGKKVNRTNNPKGVLRVSVNFNKIYAENTVSYNKGDNIRFICELLNPPKAKDLTITLTHERVGLVNVTHEIYDASPVSYKIKADEVDNESKIYCNIQKSKKYKYTTSIKLIMNHSGHQRYSIPKVEYEKDNLTKATCNENDTIIQQINGTYVQLKESMTLEPPDSDFIVFCENIVKDEKYKNDSKFYVFTRQIYNKTIYTRKKPSLDIFTNCNMKNANIKTSNDSSIPVSVTWKWYLIGSGAAIVIIILVGIILLRRKSGKKKPHDVSSGKHENIELNPNSNQVVYAELQIPEKSSSTGRFKYTNEPHYAKIVNVLQNK